MKYKISANVIRRLPKYIRRLDWLSSEGVKKVSSSDLGRQLGFTASQIRQDLNCFGGFGHQGYGYNVSQLRDGIAGVLGVEQTLTAVVVGAGNLGHAIISNFHFSECGFELLAAFDTSPSLVGTMIASTPVFHAVGLEGYLREHQVDVAVLTLPKDVALDTARLAASAGVRGIWNFTGVDLDADLGETLVEDVHLSDSLLNLGYYLREHQEERSDQSADQRRT